MKRVSAFVVLICMFSVLAARRDSGSDHEKYWPQWGGPHANGVAPHGDPPVEWSEEKNLRWKIEIPGKGIASPIIWDDKVFILTASGVTDGKNIFAYFGSHGLYCYDMQGNLRWQTDLGDMSTRNSFGEGSSPALNGNNLVVNWDHEGQSFIVALDKNNGKELWRTNRDGPTSWTTPLIVEHEGNPQVIVSATNRVRSYDLATGKLM